LPARAVVSLHHHVHCRQHPSRGLQLDGWKRFVAVEPLVLWTIRWATPCVVRRSVEWYVDVELKSHVCRCVVIKPSHMPNTKMRQRGRRWDNEVRPICCNSSSWIVSGLTVACTLCALTYCILHICNDLRVDDLNLLVNYDVYYDILSCDKKLSKSQFSLAHGAENKKQATEATINKNPCSLLFRINVRSQESMEPVLKEWRKSSGKNGDFLHTFALLKEIFSKLSILCKMSKVY